MTTLICPACDDPVDTGDEYCEACGHQLSGPIAAGERCSWCQGGVTDGFCDSCGLRQRTERDHVEIDTGAAAGVSDRGLRHSRNEDAQQIVLVPARGGHGGLAGVAAVVSDGVSASPRPDEASTLATRVGAEALAAAAAAGKDHEEATREALASAAKAVAELADSPDDAPACTYISALVTGGDEGSATIGWVGDSRAYWLSGAGSATPSALLTRDDSWSEFMVSAGRLTAEEAEASPNAHALIAWLGADAGAVDAHIASFAPGGPGALVLCSDGLWNYFPEAKALAAAVPGAHTDPLDSAQRSVRLALEAGGHDNVTVVIIPFPFIHTGQGGAA